MPAVSLEHAASERATMQALRSGSGTTPWLFPKCWRILGQEEAVYLFVFPSDNALHRLVCKFRKLYMRFYQNKRALQRMKMFGRRSSGAAAALLPSGGPPPALPVLSHSDQWVCLQ